MPKTKSKESTVALKKEEVSKENLEVAAYYHWLNRGCPVNDDLSDWVEIEKQFSASSN